MSTTHTTSGPRVLYGPRHPTTLVFDNLTAETALTKKICWNPATLSKIMRACSRHMLSKHALDPQALTAVMNEIGWVTYGDEELFATLAEKVVRWIVSNVNAEAMPTAIQAENLTPGQARCRSFKITWAAHTKAWFADGNTATVSKTEFGPPAGSVSDFSSPEARCVTRSWMTEAACVEVATALLGSVNGVPMAVAGPANVIAQPIAAAGAPASRPAPAVAELSSAAAPAPAAAELSSPAAPNVQSASGAVSAPMAAVPANGQAFAGAIDEFLTSLAQTICDDGIQLTKDQLLYHLEQPADRDALVTIFNVGLGSDQCRAERDALREERAALCMEVAEAKQSASAMGRRFAGLEREKAEFRRKFKEEKAAYLQKHAWEKAGLVRESKATVARYEKEKAALATDKKNVVVRYEAKIAALEKEKADLLAKGQPAWVKKETTPPPPLVEQPTPLGFGRLNFAPPGYSPIPAASSFTNFAWSSAQRSEVHPRKLFGPGTTEVPAEVQRWVDAPKSEEVVEEEEGDGEDVTEEEARDVEAWLRGD